jgi:hypothetical protein
MYQIAIVKEGLMIAPEVKTACNGTGKGAFYIVDLQQRDTFYRDASTFVHHLIMYEIVITATLKCAKHSYL